MLQLQVESRPAPTSAPTATSSRAHGRRRSRNCASARRHARRARDQRRSQLRQSIALLQTQVQHLEAARNVSESRRLMWQPNRTASIVELCHDYFARFAHGYRDELPLSAEAQASRDMLYAISSEDLMCREFTGVEKTLRQWANYTKFHGDFSATFTKLTRVDESDNLMSVCGVVEMRMTVVEATIRNLYPALAAEAQRDPNVQAFVQGVLDKEVVLQIDMVLHFNGQGQFVAHESRANLASGLLDAIQSPMATVKMLGAALLTGDGHWDLRDDHDVQDHPNDLPKTML